MIHPIKKVRYSRNFFLIFIIVYMACATTHAQQAIENGSVQLMNPELEVRAVPYRGERVLFHIRTGVERAIVFPEPVLLPRSNPTLPGCDIVVDINVVGFYPTETFERETIQLIGLETGNTYELGVRASPAGLLQPLRLTL